MGYDTAEKRGEKKRMAKKAQITLFIIIAIILIAGAIAYIALTRQGFDTDPMDEARQRAHQFATSDSIIFYVESCLKQATQEAVRLVGRQGGYIYDSQYSKGIYLMGPGGEICNKFPPGECDAGMNVIPYETDAESADAVSYLIKQNSIIALPFYPYSGYLKAKDPTDTFGMVVGGEKKGYPVELCDVNGQNAVGTIGAEHTCFNSYSAIDKSIQNFIEGYIAEKVQECADFSDLSLAKGVTIQAENASAEVTLGETDLIAVVHYKLNVRLSSKQSVTTIEDYSYAQPKMRLKEIYELIYYLVKEDTTNIFFDKGSTDELRGLVYCMDPSNENLRISCLKDGMNLTRINNPCIGCPKNRYADIIQVKDDYSLLDGQPYFFQFAIANRPPALDYINPDIVDSVHYYRYLSTLGKAENPFVYKKRELVIPENASIIIGMEDTLEIYPYGIDPDEEILTYRYVPINGDSTTADKLENSDLFKATKRDALLQVGSLEVGRYYVRVTVSDEEGLSDWQDLQIIVCNTSDPDSPLFCS